MNATVHFLRHAFLLPLYLQWRPSSPAISFLSGKLLLKDGYYDPRHQFREIMPLADTTIYEMEQRGFYLTSRCVVWELAKVEEWLEGVPPDTPGMT